MAKISIPIQYWAAFEEVRRCCSMWDHSYFAFTHYCLSNHGTIRQFGEWITDELQPAQWAEGIENGFVCAEDTREKEDTITLGPKNDV